MPANYTDAQGRVYNWRTGRPISIPPSRVPSSGRATSSRAPAGGVAPRRAAPPVGVQRQRLGNAWGGLANGTNAQGFGYGSSSSGRMGNVPTYVGTGGVLYDAATGRPLSGPSETGSIPPSAGSPSAPRPPATSRLQAPSARAPLSAAQPAAAPVARPGAPGMGSTRIEVPASRRRAAALNTAAQQGGLAARYDAMGPDVRLAASERSRQIGEARAAGQEIPVNLTPASEAWWNDADNAAWAKANKVLANRLREKNGLPPLDASGRAPFAVSNAAGEELRRFKPSMEGYTMKAPLMPGASGQGPTSAAAMQPGAFAPGAMPMDAAFASAGNLLEQVTRYTPPESAQAEADFRQFRPSMEGYTMGGSLASNATGRSSSPVATPQPDVFGPGAIPMSATFTSGEDQPRRAPQNALAPSNGTESSGPATDLNNAYLRKIKGMKNLGFSDTGNISMSLQPFDPNLRPSWRTT